MAIKTEDRGAEARLALAERLRAYATAAADRLWALTRPDIGQLYFTGGGLGDELMLTAVAAEARNRGRPMSILTDRPEVWESNPDAAAVVTDKERWLKIYLRKFIRTEIKHLAYINGTHQHIGEQIGRNIGIELPAGWRPVFLPRRSVSAPEGAIVVQNSCRGAQFSAYTKEWPFERWNEIVARLKDDGHAVVQIGTMHDPPIPGAMDLRGQTDLAQAAWLLQRAKLFLGLESGLMHVAAAVGAPSVIIYGGRTRPWETGYPWHWHAANISIPCAGCALNTGCPYDVECMEDISVGVVGETVERALCGEPSPGFAGRPEAIKSRAQRDVLSAQAGAYSAELKTGAQPR